VAFVETMHSVVDVLGSSQGIIAMAIAAAVGIGSPIMDRLVIRRKRIQYQVLYNSKIGLSPVFLDPDSETRTATTRTHPELAHLTEQLDKLSVLMMRVRNVGSSDIDEGDINPPLKVTFGSRVVWDARISEASDEQLRKQVREKLEFFRNGTETATGQPDGPVPTKPDEHRNLRTLRSLLSRRLANALAEPSEPAEKVKPAQQWRSVQLDGLWLRRKQSFILVVVLHEESEDATSISKEYEVTGGHRNGRTIIERRPQRRFSWPVVTTAIGVVLVGALLGTVLAKVIVGGQHPVVQDVECTTGTVNITGSSAFGPIVRTLGQTYMTDCPGSHINVDSSGSLDGVRELVQDSASAGANQAALSDGRSDEATTGLSRQLVAVLVYGLVVNKNVGVDRLSTAQVVGIYNGQYTNWQQLGGVDQPIQIVGRGASSGTRQAFERYVLHGSEGLLSSDDCLTKDRIATAPTIECERDTTQDLINAVTSVPGAIGYADVSDEATKQAERAGQLVTLTLDDRYPLVDSLPDYPFWTVEYLYTKDGQDQPLQAFLKYLNSPSAQATLLGAGYTPCWSRDNVLNPLCTSR
jgi:phosphate transport system substrate-binding protein